MIWYKIWETWDMRYEIWGTIWYDMASFSLASTTNPYISHFWWERSLSKPASDGVMGPAQAFSTKRRNSSSLGPKVARCAEEIHKTPKIISKPMHRKSCLCWTFGVVWSRLKDLLESCGIYVYIYTHIFCIRTVAHIYGRACVWCELLRIVSTSTIFHSVDLMCLRILRLRSDGSMAGTEKTEQRGTVKNKIMDRIYLWSIYKQSLSCILVSISISASTQANIVASFLVHPPLLSAKIVICHHMPNQMHTTCQTQNLALHQNVSVLFLSQKNSKIQVALSLPPSFVNEIQRQGPVHALVVPM